ncbi:hypothetical protein ACIQZG_23945 [Lysinibacillus sp. NPDC096418]|uniref:hypothetical protein n=1 Tax=Lysinibacillus sp. NPDC096418 TaxID=3364138 RepID=UPI0037F44ADA
MITINLGESKILVAYRESFKDSMRTYGLLDEETVKQMIKEDDRKLLLNNKID